MYSNVNLTKVDIKCRCCRPDLNPSSEESVVVATVWLKQQADNTGESSACASHKRRNAGIGYNPKKELANVGVEPTPFRTSDLNWRLRPLGQLTPADIPQP